MITHKHVTKIIAVVVTLSVILCLICIGFSDKLSEHLVGSDINMEYESKLFDKSDIMSINIDMDDSDWNEMLENPTSEEYHKCNVVINGTTFYNVGIRTKGNTSLSTIASDPDNDRYSFKLEFDHFVDGQTCWGLDKLIINNNFSDTTNMKEAIIYDMFEFLDADAPLYNYASISVNGSYWGAYLALEGVEQSFLMRNYGVNTGDLYKPDNLEVGVNKENDNVNGNPPSMNQIGNGQDGTPPSLDQSDNRQGGTPPTMSQDSNNSFGPPSMNDNGNDRVHGQNGGQNGGVANLKYTDDELDSYSTIWDSSIFKSSDPDHKKVISALKNINSGTNLDKYLDVDNVLKYMAVHSFAVNLDSLSGNMAHNYYLYENDGKLNILPWDYNLSFGGMSMGTNVTSSSVINDPIDTPIAGTTFFDSLLQNEEYLNSYHQYYNKLVNEYVDSGLFDQTCNRIHNQIDKLVETDPNAMYTYDEYKAGSQMLYATVKLRAKSISGQLDGSIPSTDSEQQSNADSLIDSSSIDISVMGSFGGGKPMGNKMSNQNNESKNNNIVYDTSNSISGNSSSQAGTFDKTINNTNNEFQGGNQMMHPNQSNNESQNFQATGNENNGQFQNPHGNDFNQNNQFNPMGGNNANNSININNIIWYSGSLLLIIVAIIIVNLFKRRRYQKK